VSKLQFRLILMRDYLIEMQQQNGPIVETYLRQISALICRQVLVPWLAP